MWNKLNVKNRMDYMLAYKRANKNSSYRDMVDEYNNEYLEKYPDGGSIPTTQDSTNVYNAQIALNKFYDDIEKGNLDIKLSVMDEDTTNFMELNYV